jgi:hypothetical protein
MINYPYDYFYEKDTTEELRIFYDKVANLLNDRLQKSGHLKDKFTGEDYYSWLCTGATYNKFDQAVRLMLGEESYLHYSQNAQKEVKFLFELGVKVNNPNNIDLSKFPAVIPK